MSKEPANPKPYRILVADDHAVVRRGVRALLESQPGIEVCCEAATGVEAIDHVKKINRTSFFSISPCRK